MDRVLFVNNRLPGAIECTIYFLTLKILQSDLYEPNTEFHKRNNIGLQISHNNSPALAIAFWLEKKWSNLGKTSTYHYIFCYILRIGFRNFNYYLWAWFPVSFSSFSDFVSSPRKMVMLNGEMHYGVSLPGFKSWLYHLPVELFFLLLCVSVSLYAMGKCYLSPRGAVSNLIYVKHPKQCLACSKSKYVLVIFSTGRYCFGCWVYACIQLTYFHWTLIMCP